MKKHLYIALLLISFESLCQLPDLTYHTVLGGEESEEFEKHIYHEGFYYFLCNSKSSTSHDKSQDTFGEFDIWLVKTDTNFVIIWEHSYGGSLNDFGRDLYIKDNRIYICADSYSNSSGTKSMDLYTQLPFIGCNTWVLCLNLDGNLLWQNQFGGGSRDFTKNMLPATDTSFWLFGTTYSEGGSGNRFEIRKGTACLWIVEVGYENGQLISEHAIGGFGVDRLEGVTYDEEKEHFYLCAQSNSPISFDKTVANPTNPSYNLLREGHWFLVLDKNLQILKQNVLGSADIDWGGQLISSGTDYFLSTRVSRVSGSDFGHVETYYASFFEQDIWICKLDSNLNILWQRTFGTANSEELGHIFVNDLGMLNVSITVLIEENVVGGNYLLPEHPGRRALWFLILDPDTGQTLHQENYGGCYDDYLAIYPTAHSTQEVIMAGHSESPVSGDKILPSKGSFDLWLAKLDLRSILPTHKLADKNAVLLFPNPSQGEFTLTLSGELGQVQFYVYSLDGSMIHQQSLPSGSKEHFFKLRVKAGSYLYELVGAAGIIHGRLLITH